LYDDDKDGSRKKAGGLVFNVTGVVSYAGDPAYTTLFTTELKRTLANVNVNVVINLPSVLYVTIGGTVYSNDPFDRQAVHRVVQRDSLAAAQYTMRRSMLAAAALAIVVLAWLAVWKTARPHVHGGANF
jgi:hypothetical protein